MAFIVFCVGISVGFGGHDEINDLIEWLEKVVG